MIEPVLNRLRGTGLIKHFGTVSIWKKQIEIKFVGNHLYAIYLSLVFGLSSMNVWLGLSVLIAYLLGESAGWGKWLGWLVTDIDKRNVKLVEGHQLDDEGKGYPWIHYIASIFLPEKDKKFSDAERIKRQTNFSILALAIRGIYWWLPVYLVLAIYGVIGYIEATIIGIILGLCFPLASYIGLHWNYKFKYKIFELSRGWENQEFIYGIFQGIAVWYVVIRILV